MCHYRCSKFPVFPRYFVNVFSLASLNWILKKNRLCMELQAWHQ